MDEDKDEELAERVEELRGRFEQDIDPRMSFIYSKDDIATMFEALPDARVRETIEKALKNTISVTEGERRSALAWLKGLPPAPPAEPTLCERCQGGGCAAHPDCINGPVCTSCHGAGNEDDLYGHLDCQRCGRSGHEKDARRTDGRKVS